jgi:hypothetical protein
MTYTQRVVVVIDTLNVTNMKRYIFVFFMFFFVAYLALV